jgi:plastocyanin
MRRPRTAFALVVALGLVLTLPACGDAIAEDATPVTGVTRVEVADSKFTPQLIEVPVGTTVTWTWAGKLDHNVVNKDFRSELQREGEFQHTFEVAGRYDYLCTLHPGMAGRVLVTE